MSEPLMGWSDTKLSSLIRPPITPNLTMLSGAALIEVGKSSSVGCSFGNEIVEICVPCITAIDCVTGDGCKD
jgi:hypothetical protein